MIPSIYYSHITIIYWIVYISYITISYDHTLSVSSYVVIPVVVGRRTSSPSYQLQQQQTRHTIRRQQLQSHHYHHDDDNMMYQNDTTSMDIKIFNDMDTISSKINHYHEVASSFSRRSTIQHGFLVMMGISLSMIQSPKPVMAATTTGTTNTITSDEIQRIRTGWEQINYLLDHFDEETTVCRENGGECKRDANAIRKALGLRSTTDPLFQIEKVFAKIKSLNILEDDYDKLDAIYDAVEDWNSSISMSNSMAFISQFGEYNPGGGKDEVLKYLLESKKQVLLARDALQTIMTNLNIPTTITK